MWSRPMSVPPSGGSGSIRGGSRAGSASANGCTLVPSAEEELELGPEELGDGGGGMSKTGPPRSGSRRTLSERQAWGGRKRLRLGSLRHTDARPGGRIMRLRGG